MRRLDLILSTAQRLISQIPEQQLGFMVPDRDRTLQELSFHIFKITEAFLQAASGQGLTQAMLDARPQASETAGEIVAYGEKMKQRFQKWVKTAAEVSFDEKVQTYYGQQPLHELLERTCWHSAQHLRQLAKMLEMIDIVPDKPLTTLELQGLPLPRDVWG